MMSDNSSTATANAEVTISYAPLVNDNHVNQHDVRNEASMKLKWRDLSYEVAKSSGLLSDLVDFASCSRRENKRIFAHLNGSVEAGQMLAIMGPSGAGKSCLLASLSGQRSKGVTGEVLITGPAVEDGTIGLSAITLPQYDYLMEEFTVRESLYYATRVKNVHFSSASDHDHAIDLAVAGLKMNSCLDTKVPRCSGGERRRLSIALELVSKPDILFLDEPTSGLDSASADYLVSLLRDLAHTSLENGRHMIVVVVIHQPSSNLLNMFDKAYILASGGLGCVFDGPPRDLVQALLEAGIEITKYDNPADIVMDVTCGDFGTTPIANLLAKYSKPSIVVSDVESGPITSNREVPLQDCISLHKWVNISQYLFLVHFWILLRRELSRFFKDRLFIALDIGCSLGVAILFGFVYGDVGREPGCLPRSNLTDHLMRKFTDNSDQDFVYSHFNQDDYQRSMSRITDNTLMLDSVMLAFAVFGTIHVALTFPLQVIISRKETNNNWYNFAPLYAATSITEFVPVFYTAPILIYVLFGITHQDIPSDRVLLCLVVFSAFFLVCQAIGTLMGTVFCENPSLGILAAIMFHIPSYLLSGNFVTDDQLSAFMRHFIEISWIRHTYHGFVWELYGDRCECPKENLLWLPNQNITSILLHSGAGSTDLLSCDHRAFPAISCDLGSDATWIALAWLGGIFLSLKTIQLVSMWFKLRKSII